MHCVYKPYSLETFGVKQVSVVIVVSYTSSYIHGQFRTSLFECPWKGKSALMAHHPFVPRQTLGHVTFSAKFHTLIALRHEK